MIAASTALPDEKRGVEGGGPNWVIAGTPPVIDLSPPVSIEIFAPGYIATYAIAAAIIIAHLVHMVRRGNAFSLISDARASAADDRLTQAGYRRCTIGHGIRISAILFALWLQIAIIISIIGHYNGVWIFDLSIARGTVDWDSYTRVFLMAWSASILMAVACRVFQDQLRTFYMMPAPLSEATYVKLTQVLIDSSDPQGNMAVTHREILPIRLNPVRHVDFLLRRYTWSEADKMFVPGKFFSKQGPKGAEAEAIRRVGGISSSSASDRSIQFGRNEVVLSVPSLFRMTVTELSSFFYIYQISACWLPFYWDYITVGFLTLTLVLVSAVVKILMERKQKGMLRNMATLHGQVWAKRDGQWTKLLSEELVVGDLVCLTAGSEDTCKDVLADCLVISGHAIVDEAALTGETMPIQKFACPTSDQHRNPQDAESKKYYVFAGTGILQTGGAHPADMPTGVTDGTIVVVAATGAGTVRGELMRGLIFGASLKSSLFIELRYSLSILIVIALLDFLTLNARFQMSLSSMLTAMYSIIGLINPLMAVSLVAGELRSANRLKSHKEMRIFTRDLHRLTIAGKVDLALLDKTGTITKSGLDFYGVIPTATLQLTDCSNTNTDISAELSAALALAHSVSKCRGQLIGHQVELRMVETARKIGWVFQDDLRSASDASGKKWTVEKLFPFSHETMTMTALVTCGGRRFAICKGSIEALMSRCTGVTTAMTAKADTYAKDGCYVLGVGMKEIKGDATGREILREETETDLGFAGLLLFRNEVKPDSRQAISELQSAGIDVAMMTGDSVYTGAAVAKTVGIISPESRVVIGTMDATRRRIEWRLSDSELVISDEALVLDSRFVLCITGEVFAELSRRGTLNLDATKVYGRVSPNQKAEIVKLYTNKGKVVSMCGDGANDSSGLRAAHAGLALSGRTEASISAPFSTDSESLLALTLLVREARAALCTSLASYQTLVVVGILYCVSKSILLFQATAYQAGLSYLYLDLITTPLMLYALVHSLPAKKLANTSPEGSLLGGQIVMTSIWSIFVSLAFLALADAIMVTRDWFVPFNAGLDVGLEEWQKRGNNYEAALIFIWSAWVYVDIPLAYSVGGAHRAPMYTNWRLVLATMFLMGSTLAVMFTGVGDFGCYFKVACSAAASAKASNAWVNHFLFPYEQVGGTWYNMDIDSTEYPVSFKVGLFFILLSMSVVHHVGHFFITHKLAKYVKDKLGWDGLSIHTKKGYLPQKDSLKVTEADLYEDPLPSIVEIRQEPASKVPSSAPMRKNFE